MDTMLVWSKNQESQHGNEQRFTKQNFTFVWGHYITSVSEQEKYYGLFHLSAVKWRADKEEAGADNATNLHIGLPSMNIAVSLQSLQILGLYHQINPNQYKHGRDIHFHHPQEASFFYYFKGLQQFGSSLGSFAVFLQIYNIIIWAGCWSVFIAFASMLHVSLTINSSFLLWEDWVPVSAWEEAVVRVNTLYKHMDWTVKWRQHCLYKVIKDMSLLEFLE